jgi:hypothetical protein
MPLSGVVQILFRIFSLHWLLTGLIQGSSIVIISRDRGMLWWSLLPSIVYLVAGLVFWRIAPWFSRALAKGTDDSLRLDGVSERTLFATAFISLGTYFALDSFASVFSWGHFFAISKSDEYGFHHEEAPSYYELSEALMTLAAGVLLILTAKRWAAKLADSPGEKASGGDS